MKKKFKIKPKKGQIGIILIIGVVLIIIVLLLLLPKKEKLKGITTGPEEIISFTSTCLDESIKEALYLVGMNGGLKDVSNLKYSPLIKDSEAVDAGGWIIPYWVYADECEKNKYCIYNRILPLCADISKCPINSAGENSIEESVEELAKEKLIECISHFSPLKERFKIIEENELDVDVRFTKENVEAILTFRIRYEDLSTGDKGVIDTFSASENLNMVDIYLLSKDIAIGEIETNFIENVVLHTMSIYQGIDKPLPPFREVGIGFKNNIWLRTEVKEFIITSVLPYINLIQIANALEGFKPVIINISKPTDYYVQGFYTYFSKNLGNETRYPNLEATLIYPGTDIYLDFNKKEILKPRKLDVGGFLGKLVGGLLLEDYRFYYNMAFPVVVSIKDPNAFNGEGYSFTYAIEGNLIRNSPINTSVEYSSSEIENNLIDIESPEYFVDSIITINVFDKYSQKPISDALIEYLCAGKTFYIGVTKTERNGVYWRGKIPYCPVGGVIRASHKDYKEELVDFNSEIEGLTKTITLSLWPIQNKTVIIMKRTLENISNISSDFSEKSLLKYRDYLSENDTAFIGLEREKEHPLEENFPLLGFVTSEGKKIEESLSNQNIKDIINMLYQQGNITAEQRDEWIKSIDESYSSLYNYTTKPFETTNILLVPGDYKINGFLIYNGLISLPEEKIEECVLGGLKCTERTIEAKNYTQWMTGYTNLTKVRFYPGDVYEDNVLILYLPDKSIPKKWKDIFDYEPTISSNLVWPRFEKR